MKDRYKHLYTNTERKKYNNTSRKRVKLTKKQRVLARLSFGTLLIFVGIVLLGGAYRFVQDIIRGNDSDTEDTEEIIEVPALVGVAERFPDQIGRAHV